MVTLDNLAIGYEAGSEIRHSLCATLKQGEITCLLGLNGTGKSTLLKTICGFQKPLSGKILVMGKPLQEWSLSKLSSVIGVVLTEKGNAGGLTVREVVSLGRQPHTGFFGKLDENDRHIICESMEKAGISHKAESFISSLSDGERQRTFIAKALAQECPVLILDEPTAFLDVLGRREIMDLLANLAHSQNKAVLLSTHDIDLALQKADTLWIMDETGSMATENPKNSEKIITDLLYHDWRK